MQSFQGCKDINEDCVMGTDTCCDDGYSCKSHIVTVGGLGGIREVLLQP